MTIARKIFSPNCGANAPMPPPPASYAMPYEKFTVVGRYTHALDGWIDITLDREDAHATVITWYCSERQRVSDICDADL